MSRSLDNVFREVQQLSSKSESRHQDLSHKAMSNEQLSAMDKRIQSIESTLQGYTGQFSNIQSSLKDSHSTLNQGLTEHMTHSKYLLCGFVGLGSSDGSSHINQNPQDE